MPTQVNPQRITKNTLPPYGRLLLIMAVSLYTSRVVLNTLRCLTEEPSGCPSPPRLSRYVNDGRFCIDNNLVENAIRPLALGRKNFLFCGNHDAATRAAIVYSLVDSCKALDVDPREWMEDVLLRIPGNENNREALRELLPDRWAKQTN